MANTRITQGVIKPNEDYDVRHINATGIITATNVNVSGVLTYEDVQNVDSIGITLANVSGSGCLVGVGITRPSTDDVKVLKNVPIPQGSSLEFMAGNKVVLETADTLTVDSDTNNSIDATLTIMEIT